MAMVSLEVNESVILEQRKALEAALTSNPKTEKVLRKLIREVIMQARAQVVGAAEKSMKSDPRHAAQAVRTAVYKKVLGANINIYNSRKAHGSTSYVPPRKGSTGRGGNRRSRSGRTEQIMSYDALDRGFILRWVNDGMTKTNPRVIKFTPNDNRKADRWNHNPNTGNRGAISGRHWFKGAAEAELVKAADNLANIIDEELAAILNKTK